MSATNRSADHDPTPIGPLGCVSHVFPPETATCTSVRLAGFGQVPSSSCSDGMLSSCSFPSLEALPEGLASLDRSARGDIQEKLTNVCRQYRTQGWVARRQIPAIGLVVVVVIGINMWNLFAALATDAEKEEESYDNDGHDEHDHRRLDEHEKDSEEAGGGPSWQIQVFAPVACILLVMGYLLPLLCYTHGKHNPAVDAEMKAECAALSKRYGPVSLSFTSFSANPKLAGSAVMPPLLKYVTISKGVGV